MQKDERQVQLLARYREGRVPWDDVLPPPEVVAVAARLSAGWVLDLGCGYGRAAIYLARLGWRAVGVDFVHLAVAEARHRALAAGVGRQTLFVQGRVTELGFLNGRFDFILDVGCLHNLTEPETAQYSQHVTRLLKKGGTYQLFAHLRDEKKPSLEEQRWIAEQTILTQFQPHLTLVKAEKGWTQVENNPPWQSAWFWFQK
ncbi:MAG: class I SAM-dependent methyltransferase [Candidatus Promineifilaceae bacterium]